MNKVTKKMTTLSNIHQYWCNSLGFVAFCDGQLIYHEEEPLSICDIPAGVPVTFRFFTGRSPIKQLNQDITEDQFRKSWNDRKGGE